MTLDWLFKIREIIMKKKILYIHHGGSEGGAPTSLKLLMMELDRNRYEPYILCIGDDGGNRSFFADTGAKYLFEPQIKAFHGSTVCTPSFCNWRIAFHNVKGIIPTIKGIRRILNQIKPDIVHLNSTCLCMAAMGIRLFSPSTPIVMHIREPVLCNFWGKVIKKISRRYVNFFIAIDKYDMESIGDNLVNSAIVYNPVNFDKMEKAVQGKSDLRYELNLPEGCVIFLYLARIIPPNGCMEMINEFKLLDDKRAALIIAGFSSDETDYERLCHKTAESVSNIYTLPFTFHPENLLVCCDVVVSPFKEPHFSRTIIEAASIGKPCIASNVCALNEVVIDRRTGLLYNTENIHELGYCFRHFLDRPSQISALGNNAKKFAHESFDSVKNAQTVFEIYDKLFSYSGNSK